MALHGYAKVAVIRHDPRRLIAWFRRSQPLRSQKAPEPANDGAAFDLDEFGRLLNSGKNRRPSKNRTCPKPAGKRPEQVVSTKSRQVIFGSRIRGALLRIDIDPNCRHHAILWTRIKSSGISLQSVRLQSFCLTHFPTLPVRILQSIVAVLTSRRIENLARRRAPLLTRNGINS